MPIDMNDDENTQPDPDDYYESLASQEEIYLEETEEELREILIFEDPSPSESDNYNSDDNNNKEICATQTADEQLEQAVKELITDDSDAPPLSEEAVVEMIKLSHLYDPSST